jgi:hypothetical protein
MAALPTPTPAVLAVLARPTRVPFDRKAWERALLNSGATHDERAVGLVLAHITDRYGELPAGGPQTAGHLARLTRLQDQRVRLAITALELKGFTTRPSIHTWPHQSLVRPLALSIPASPVRTEPAHMAVVSE